MIPQASVRPRLLVAEDDAGFRETLALEFEDRGFEVTQVGSLGDFQAVAAVCFDYAVVDLKLGSDHGLKVVEQLSRSQDHCKTVVLTGYGSIATAVQAMQLGATNYLTKPASTARIAEAFLGSDGRHEFGVVSTSTLSLARLEREYIETVLAQCGGNISRAASKLGLHRQSLQRKLRKLPPPR